MNFKDCDRDIVLYRAVSLVDGKMYIGKTIGSFYKRAKRHNSNSNAYKYDCYFYNAIRKHGIDSFEWDILRICDNDKELEAWEQYYILYYDTYKNGYNMTLGGGGTIGYKPTKESNDKRKRAGVNHWNGSRPEIRGKNNPMYGVHRFGKDAPNYGKKRTYEKFKNLTK